MSRKETNEAPIIETNEAPIMKFRVPYVVTFDSSNGDQGKVTIRKAYKVVEIKGHPAKSKAAKQRQAMHVRQQFYLDSMESTWMGTCSHVQIGTPIPEMTDAEKIADIMDRAHRSITEVISGS